jgi:hypothetical protein
MDSDRDNQPVDAETLLFTLDQLSQTVEVMNKVIGRLRGYVQQNMTAERQGQLEFEREAGPGGPPSKGSGGLH